ncbi:MAG TPA: hypothetical protein VFE84_13765 [Patescibacteria group bacterium]|jgi:hypothetical protein|nr:hypothetical protein [Patescibacteria group bacterium]
MTTLEKTLINLSTLLVGLSGILYGWMKYLMTTDDPYAVANHPLQPWALDLHVLASPVLVLALGMIVQDHVVTQLQKGPGRPGRSTGLMAAVCVLPMIATGYLIQVFVDETARRVCVGVHLVTGMIYLAAFLAHLVMSRRAAARRKTEAAQAAAAGMTTAAWRAVQARERVLLRSDAGAPRVSM